MSQENLELVHRMLQHFNSGDIEEWLSFWGPEAEWMAVAYAEFEGRPREYRGHAGLRRFRADLLETFADACVEPSELLDVDDFVLVLGEFKGKGTASRASFESRMAWLFEVQDGMVVRGRDYLNQQAALDAAGLRK
jgi:ketosteroid isomerase-like protein